MPLPIRLLLIDNHTLFQRSLAALLQRRRNLQVVGEAATAEEALAQARSCQPDVAVVEPELPGGGPELVAALCQEAPSSAVLVLTFARDEDAAARALQAGARGYLQKSCEPGELVRAIERVHAGELVLAPAIAPTLLKSLAGEPTRGPEPNELTERELEVLRLVAQGKTNPQIGEMLCITEHTVKAHLAKILHKLRLDNRVQLATYAMQHGLASATEASASASRDSS